MTHRNTWKELERKTAKLLNGKRNPLSSSNSLHTSGDIIHDTFYVECKLRKKLSVVSQFQQVRENAKKENKIPILVLKEKGKHSELVVMDMKDFNKILNGYKT